MRRIAGAVVWGLSLLAIVFAQVGTRALAQNQLRQWNSAPGNPMDYLPTLDVVIMYGSVLAGIALVVWPERKQ